LLPTLVVYTQMTKQTAKKSKQAEPKRQLGAMLLTEGRSGLSWLGQLTTTRGEMGISLEWLNPNLLEIDPKQTDAKGYLAAVIAAASLENSRFALKIFPGHLFWFADTFGVDFLTLCMEYHDVAFARSRRRDRLVQAVSLVKACQSGRWSSLNAAMLSGIRQRR